MAMDSPASAGSDVSIVTVVMNRLAHLMATAPQLSRWGGHREHLIVDWSSAIPIDRRSLPADPRIRLVRVEGETGWQLSRAYNFAIHMAAFEMVLKLDADCWIDPLSSPLSVPAAGAYLRSALGGGLNGVFMIRREDFFSVGGFNELLRGYGHDDKDLYQRLERRLVRRDISAGVLHTIEHGDLERVAADEASRRSGTTRQNAWMSLQAIALMEESKGINRLLAERIEWGRDSGRSRYQCLTEDRWQVVEASVPVVPRAMKEMATGLGTRIYLSHLLGLPERFLEMRIPARDLERIRRWRRFLKIQAIFRITTLMALVRLGLLLSRRLAAPAGGRPGGQ